MQEEHLDALSHYINTINDSTTHYFVIDPTGTNLMQNNLMTYKDRRALTFIDVSTSPEGCVNKVSQHINSLTSLPEPYFKAVCSCEDETILFPVSTDDEFCQQVALYMAEKHPLKL